jgi:hypothetical protein
MGLVDELYLQKQSLRIFFQNIQKFNDIKLGKAYERESRLRNSSFFRLKGVIWYLMHRFHFHLEYSTIVINLKSCGCLLSEYLPIIIELL